MDATELAYGAGPSPAGERRPAAVAAGDRGDDQDVWPRAARDSSLQLQSRLLQVCYTLCSLLSTVLPFMFKRLQSHLSFKNYRPFTEPFDSKQNQ